MSEKGARMFKSGLVSISFRKNTVDEIISASCGAGLQLIEWGSDIHLPPEDMAPARLAERIKQKTESAGLSSVSYGSYYRIGINPTSDFLPLIRTAITVGARIIRVWGYNTLVSPESEELWNRLVTEAQAISDMAKEYGITVALECHNNTVTAHYKNALAFLRAVDRESFRTYWQPNQLLDKGYNLDAARALAPYTVAIHAFNWSGKDKYPLADAEDTWREYLDCFAERASTSDIPVLLEFMPDGKLSTLAREAATLGEILSGY